MKRKCQGREGWVRFNGKAGNWVDGEAHEDEVRGISYDHGVIKRLETSSRCCASGRTN